MLMFSPVSISVDDELKQAHLARVKRALSYADIKPDKAAVWMAIDRAQLHRALEGQGHLKLTHLMLLPADFWQFYGLLIVEDLGLPPLVKRAARLYLALLSRKRMVKMAAKQEAAEKRTA